MRGLGCKEKLLHHECISNFLPAIIQLPLRHHQIFLINCVYQNTLHHIIHIEFYNLKGSFLFSAAIFNSLGLYFYCSFFFIFTHSPEKDLMKHFIATPSSTLLIKILNMERAIPLKPHLELHILLVPWPLYLQTLSQFSLNRSILWLLMFKSNLNYLKLHEELANDLIMFKYKCHLRRKWFHNSIKTAIGFVRSNLFYRTHCLLQITIPLAF